MKPLLLLVVVFAISTTAIAVTPPPDQPFRSQDWPASLSKEPSTGATLGTLRVRFEQTTLDQVLHAVAVGTVAHQGDAAESIYWLCYTTIRRGVAERIWIISDGEMGGNEHAITGITASRERKAKATADCPLLPSALQPVSLDHLAWLGSSDQALSKVLGQPSHQEGAWRSYDFQSKVPGNCEGGYDLMNWLLTKSEKGSVTSIYAGQVTSC